MRPLHLRISNTHGGVENYFHFLLGFALPLAGFLADHPAPGRLWLRSCGPMDRVLGELALPARFLDPRLHRLLGATRHVDPLLRFVKIFGWDSSAAYDGTRIKRAGAWVRDRLAAAIATHDPDRRRAIVLIRRANEPAARRVIANHGDLAAALPGALDVDLASMTLAAQIALFGAADLVVAQHGAALANMVWMRHGARVIEIVDPHHARADYFPALARVMGLNLVRIDQAHPRAPVDVARVAAVAAAR